MISRLQSKPVTPASEPGASGLRHRSANSATPDHVRSDDRELALSYSR